MKVLAMYLPQYHQIKENDAWWGNGYTEWNAVRNAMPQYKGHCQPRVPFEHNYYDLSDETGTVWKWQAGLARKYGIYGFCIYHYWFETGRQLLEKPMEILLRHPEIDIHYCICWANETWTRTWYDLENQILMEQKYGGKEEWKTHFEYLLPFFLDERYIKIDNKPVIHIYRTCEIEKLEEMKSLWERLAVHHGFDGVYLIAGNTACELEAREQTIDAYYNFEPGYSLKHKLGIWKNAVYLCRGVINVMRNKVGKKKCLERRIHIRNIYQCIEKESQWEKTRNKPVFRGTLPRWDNTPRRSYKGMEYYGSSPEEFKRHLKKLKESLKENEAFFYINAWNEWGEGAYLEPDENTKYEYLKALEILKEKEE